MENVLCISESPMHTMKGIQSKVKLKDDKMKKTDGYLGANISIMNKEQGDECWAMSSDKYCAAMVKNVEENLSLQDSLQRS